jgi:putative ABC transport system permease protein
MRRWAWRLFRREWRQQLLIVALIAVAVAATVVGAGIATSTSAPPNATLGGASYAVTLPGGAPDLAATIATITSEAGRRGPVQVIEHQRLATGSVSPVELRSESPTGPFARTSLALLGGHYPGRPDEVAMTRSVATLYDVGIGDRWRAAGRSWQVTGLVDNPDNLLDSFALTAPGQLPAPTAVSILLDTTPGFPLPPDATLVAPPAPSSGFSPGTIVLVVAILGLLFAGMIASAGFTVIAQRRLRALGMVSALGATRRDVRRVMTANGAIVGMAATLAGAAAGFAAWFAYAPHLQARTAHRIDELSLPWWTIGVTTACAVLTAVRAARRPARAIADLPVVAALAGRSPRPTSAHRTALPGLILLAGGAYLLAASGGWGASGDSATLHLLGGLIAMILGAVLVGPLGIGILAALGRHAPVAERLAFRDLARYRARPGAALSAISATVFVAVLVFLIAGARYSTAIDYFGPNLPANQLVVYTPAGAAAAGYSGQNLCASDEEPTAPALRRDEAGIRAIASTLRTNDVVTLRTATGLLIQTSDGGTDIGLPYVATPQLLAHYGITSADIRPDAVLLSARRGLTGVPDLQLPLTCTFHNTCPPTSCVANPTVQTVAALPPGSAEPNLVLTPNAVHRYGLHPTTAAWLVQANGPLTANQINSARQQASALGLVIETKNGNPSLSELDTWATAAGMVLALGVLVMTVGLIRGETANDLRILTAAGAGRGVRRALTAATASGLGLLGAVIGTAVAYLAAAAYFHTEPSRRLNHVPVTDLVLILVGLPLVAAAGAWLVSGGQPSAVARQPVE